MYFDEILNSLETENKKEWEELERTKTKFFDSHAERMSELNTIINKLDQDMTQERIEQLHKRNLESISKLNEMLDTL